MILGLCPKPNTGPIPTKLAYVRFSLLFFNLLQIKGGSMLLILILVAAAVLAIAANSVRLFLLACLALAITLFPLVALPSIGAVIWWVIKTNLKR
jgi:hypothetical protein